MGVDDHLGADAGVAPALQLEIEIEISVGPRDLPGDGDPGGGRDQFRSEKQAEQFLGLLSGERLGGGLVFTGGMHVYCIGPYWLGEFFPFLLTVAWAV